MWKYYEVLFLAIPPPSILLYYYSAFQYRILVHLRLECDVYINIKIVKCYLY